MPTVYLDLDSTVVDLMRPLYRMYGLEGEALEKAYYDTTWWDAMYEVLEEHAGIKTNPAEFWGKVDDLGEDFWANLPFHSWGRELYKVCAQYGQVVLMSTPTRHPSSAAGKMRWIQKNLPELSRHYAFTPCKHLMAHPGAVLVDDREENVRKFREHGGAAILVPQPWNSAFCSTDPQNARLPALVSLRLQNIQIQSRLGRSVK